MRDIDRYGRMVGRIFVGAVNVSAELVTRGAAWAEGLMLADRQANPIG